MATESLYLTAIEAQSNLDEGSVDDTVVVSDSVAIEMTLGVVVTDVVAVTDQVIVGLVVMATPVNDNVLLDANTTAIALEYARGPPVDATTISDTTSTLINYARTASGSGPITDQVIGALLAEAGAVASDSEFASNSLNQLGLNGAGI